MSKRQLVTLPNGSCLKYASGYQKGEMSKWWRSEDIQLPEDHTSADGSKNLSKIFRLSLWSSCTTQHVLCADFDDLPPNFKNFNELVEHLNWQYSNEAVVTYSRREKAKMFFVVELPKGTKISRAVAELTLTKMLEPVLAELFDRAGMHVTFLTPNMKKALQERLHLLAPILAAIPLEIPSPVKIATPLKQAAGPLPLKLYNFVNGGTAARDSNSREKFIRMLLGTPLLRDEFAISTKKCAADCGVSPMAISNWRNQLVSAGQLERTNKQFFPGKKAQTFKARGELLASLPPVPPKGTLTSLACAAPPSSVIKDGSWDEAVRKAVNYFHGDSDQTYAWFRGCNGHDQKDREAKVKAWLKSYHRHSKKARTGS